MGFVASINLSTFLHLIGHPAVTASSLLLALICIILLSLRVKDRKAEAEYYRGRLKRKHEEYDRCKSDLDTVRHQSDAMKEANRKLRLLLAHKEEELSSALGRPAAPLPPVAQPEGPLGTLAESLAITSQRLQAAAERMQLAMEVRKAALARLVAAGQALRAAVPEKLRNESRNEAVEVTPASTEGDGAIEVVEFAVVPEGFPRGKLVH